MEGVDSLESQEPDRGAWIGEEKAKSTINGIRGAKRRGSLARTE
ncbi:hypothetical protein [Halorhabdus rudnickae]|nr:hypothetical protein [Halorhabdus rudnickae]